MLTIHLDIIEPYSEYTGHKISIGKINLQEHVKKKFQIQVSWTWPSKMS